MSQLRSIPDYRGGLEGRRGEDRRLEAENARLKERVRKLEGQLEVRAAKRQAAPSRVGSGSRADGRKADNRARSTDGMGAARRPSVWTDTPLAARRTAPRFEDAENHIDVPESSSAQPLRPMRPARQRG